MGWRLSKKPKFVHQKDVYYRLGIWHLDLTFKTKTRMFTHQPKEGHPPEESIQQKRFLELSLKSEN